MHSSMRLIAGPRKCGGLFGALAFCLLPLLFCTSPTKANDDIWSVSPSNNNWNNGGNWVLGVVPNGTGDVATFITSSLHTARLSADVNLASVAFTSGADAFTIDTNGNALALFGTGIGNASSHTQTLLTGMPGSIISFNNQASADDVRITAQGGTTVFHDNSTASSASITTSLELFSGSNQRGILRFTDSATAANATIANTTGEVDNTVPLTQFLDSSTAASAQITNVATGGPAANFHGGKTEFLNNSKAGSATITNKGADAANAIHSGGVTSFLDSSRAQNATIINGAASGESNGGATIFANDSSANSAMITNQGNSAPHAFLNVAAAAYTSFENNATAANATIDNNGGTGDNALGGLTGFSGNATAANATITNHAGQTGHQLARSGVTSFSGNATAANATIDNNAPASVDADGGETDFTGNSTAGNATITNHGAFANSQFITISITAFSETSDAGSATIDNRAGGITSFDDTATALNARITNSSNNSALPSATVFSDSSKAGNATIINNAFGQLYFYISSRAGTATIINHGDGFIQFRQDSSAANATITNSSGNGDPATMRFFDSSTAGNASITTGNDGRVQFFDSSSGGSATFVTNGGGSFDISSLTTAGTTAGSIAGAGTYFLGSKNLTVGSDNSSTQVSGLIRDGGNGGGAGGSITKAGAGTLELTHANTYTGGTIISAGKLLANNTTGSATGGGAVTVQSGGRLGGNGAVSGAVTVEGGGHIAPGESVGSLGTGNLALTQLAQFDVELDPGNVQGNGPADLLIVSGSVNLGLGDLVLNLRSAPLPGQSFTILDNDGVDPIVGLFAQGAQVSGTFGNQTYPFLINYDADADGGGVFNVGNDIVLTSLVPEPSPATFTLLGLCILLRCREVTRVRLGRTTSGN
jgi:autotransporter-associated beta strand protein